MDRERYVEIEVQMKMNGDRIAEGSRKRERKHPKQKQGHRNGKQVSGRAHYSVSSGKWKGQ